MRFSGFTIFINKEDIINIMKYNRHYAIMINMRRFYYHFTF